MAEPKRHMDVPKERVLKALSRLSLPPRVKVNGQPSIIANPHNGYQTGV